MMKTFIANILEDKGRLVQRLIKPVLGLVLLAMVAGCQTQRPVATPAKQTTDGAEVITLREGDVLKISFPGSANLNTTQPIRRDGMISMPLIGEVKAVGKTPEGLKKELIDLYSTQLVSKEVTVEVQSSLFPVYVNGAVLHPGKIMSDHPMTAFDAIMEAGGFDYTKANLKRVVVIRQEGGRNRKFTLNLKLVMDGKPGEPFYVKPGDTITVPEKFQWF
jgi:polysaccharide export outer membrane protein